MEELLNSLIENKHDNRLKKPDREKAIHDGYDLIGIGFDNGRFHFQVQIEGEEEIKVGAYAERTVALKLRDSDFVSGHFIDDWDGIMYVAFVVDNNGEDVNSFYEIEKFVINTLTIQDQRELFFNLIS